MTLKHAFQRSVKIKLREIAVFSPTLCFILSFSPVKTKGTCICFNTSVPSPVSRGWKCSLFYRHHRVGDDSILTPVTKYHRILKGKIRMWRKHKNISFPFVSETDASLLIELGDFSPWGKSICQAAAASLSDTESLSLKKWTESLILRWEQL